MPAGNKWLKLEIECTTICVESCVQSYNLRQNCELIQLPSKQLPVQSQQQKH